MSTTLSEDDLIALLRRTMDEHGYLQPLLDDPDSRAALLALVRIYARLGAALPHNADALTIGGASGGQPGFASITMTRAASSTSGTIPANYQFVDARGVRVRLQTHVPVAVGQTTVVLPVVTARQSELVISDDDPGFVVAPDEVIVLDSLATTVLIAPPGSAGLVSTSFHAVTSATPIVGGAADYLSVHGGERGLIRQTSEQEAEYRTRIRNIPDVVSPFAVADAVLGAIQREGLPDVLIREPFNDQADAALKDPRRLTFFSQYAYDADAAGEADFFDDPLSNHLLTDRRTTTAYFEIRLQDYVRDPDASVAYYDDAFFDDPVFGYPDSVLGMGLHPVVMAALMSLIHDVQAKKPAGVNFDVFMREPDDEVGVGSSSSASETLVWALAPPTGKIWVVTEAYAGHDSPTPNPVFSHKVVFNLESGATLDSGASTATHTRRLPIPGERVTSIFGFVTSNGSVPVNLVGGFRVHAITL